MSDAPKDSWDFVVDLEKQLATERARADKAEEDTRRIDWAESNLSLIRDIGWMNDNMRLQRGPSLRDAIDKAMKGEK